MKTKDPEYHKEKNSCSSFTRNTFCCRKGRILPTAPYHSGSVNFVRLILVSRVFGIAGLSIFGRRLFSLRTLALAGDFNAR